MPDMEPIWYSFDNQNNAAVEASINNGNYSYSDKLLKNIYISAGYTTYDEIMFPAGSKTSWDYDFNIGGHHIVIDVNPYGGLAEEETCLFIAPVLNLLEYRKITTDEGKAIIFDWGRALKALYDGIFMTATDKNLENLINVNIADFMKDVSERAYNLYNAA